MKRRMLSLFPIIFIIGCSSSSINDPAIDSQYISFTLSKDNKVETLKITDESFLTGASYFDTLSIKFTTIGLFNKINSEPYYLSLTFPGNTVGVYDWSESGRNSINIIRNQVNPFPLVNPIPMYWCFEGQTNLVIYGSVGERVEGNLSGTIIESTAADTINISGEFSVQRLKDYSHINNGF